MAKCDNLERWTNQRPVGMAKCDNEVKGLFQNKVTMVAVPELDEAMQTVVAMLSNKELKPEQEELHCFLIALTGFRKRLMYQLALLVAK